MINKTFSWDLFYKIPIVGIMRNVLPNKIKTIASIFANTGLTNLEITMNSKGTPEIIADLIDTMGTKLNIGAGTVCSLKELDIALSSGAQFIVSPVINEEVIKRCVAEGIPVFPGAYTPTEIYKAWSLGVPMVKVFPATKLGPDYIKEVLAPLSDIKLLPTGGINLENFSEFLAIGAKGVGIGSQLFPENLIGDDDWDALQIHFSGFITKYKTS
jgi:2-dehydro-3-deoxyphosphogluconate aldolase/(4S)-4-hydroxy-2-oxoglutarate aldolase